MLRRQAAVGGAVSLALGAALMISCGAGSEVVSTAGSAPDASSTRGLTEVDTRPLANEYSYLGSAVSGNRLPILRVGADDESSSILLLDSESASLDPTPPLPVDGWVTGSALMATPSDILVSAKVCDTRPVDGDAGFECPGKLSYWFLRMPDNASEWQAAPIPSATSTPNITTIAGNEVVLTQTGQQIDLNDIGEPAPSKGIPGWVAHLSPDLSITESSNTAPLTCASTTPNAVFFDSRSEPKSASLVDPDTGRESSTGLTDDGTQQVKRALDKVCYSAGAFVAIPGRIKIPDIPNNSLDQSAVDGPTAAPPPPPTPEELKMQVFDARDPDRTVVRAGDSFSFNSFGATSDYWVLADDSGLHTNGGPDGGVRDIPLEPGAQVRALDSRIVAYWSFDGGDKRLVVIPA